MPSHFFRFISPAVFCLAAQTTVVGQGIAPRAEPVMRGGQPAAGYPPPAASWMDRPSTVVDPDRKLQPGDQLSLLILEDNEPAPMQRVVSAAGEVDISPLGSVRVAGLNAAQASGAIKRFLEGDYYYRATVRLSIDRVNDAASMGTIYLSGEINAVGAQAIAAGRPLLLSQAILNAGGFRRYAASKDVKVTRDVGGKPQTYTVNVKEINEKGRTEKDMVLQDGDRIFVPESFIKY